MTHLMLRLFARYLPEVEAARAKQGLPPVGSARGILDVYHRADLRLIQTCEAFDFPIKPAPANVRYVGPVLDDPDWTHAAADPEVPADSRPLVVVGLSSTFQNQRDTLQRIISALGTLDVRGLVTLGPAMARERFATPPNVMTVASASHAGLFPLAPSAVGAGFRRECGGHGRVHRPGCRR